MGVFMYNKQIENIEEPALVPKDWYEAEIVEEPELRMNNELSKLVEDDASPEAIEEILEENERAGFNLVVKIRIAVRVWHVGNSGTTVIVM